MRPKPNLSTAQLAKKTAKAASRPAATARPLWLFVTEPGLGPLALKELQFQKNLKPKTRATKLHLRNYDLLAVPDVQVTRQKIISRVVHEALLCPVFGKHKISDRQLTVLARAMHKNNADGFVSSVAGNHFARQDLLRWLHKGMAARDIDLSPQPQNPVHLYVVDEHYYFGLSQFNQHAAPGRMAASARSGALPATIAAAMGFAAAIQASDCVWDATCGTGTVLAEAAMLQPAAIYLGTDLDAAAIKIAKDRARLLRVALQNKTPSPRGEGGVRGKPEISFTVANSLSFTPPQLITLSLSNLPFGQQFTPAGGTKQFYTDLLAHTLRRAAANWRGIYLTSDSAALEQAARANNLALTKITDLQTRGTVASIYKISKN